MEAGFLIRSQIDGGVQPLAADGGADRIVTRRD
jgi:hypothetical protein